MTAHSILSPSSAHRWMPCPASLSFPENRERSGSTTYADDGTASHDWAARILKDSETGDAAFYCGETLDINGTTYTMDEERAGHVQTYVDYVRREAMGASLFVEVRVDLSPWLGEGSGGTADAIILRKGSITVVDFKYGMGERVDAERNPQLMLYALGAVEYAKLLGFSVNEARVVIVQPRIGHISEWVTSVSALLDFGDTARVAGETALKAVAVPPPATDFGPGDKACRWCAAKYRCPALAKKVASEVKCDFDTILVDAPPAVPVDTVDLSQAINAVPIIKQWCAAVEAEVHRRVGAGQEVIGSDGLPMKFVEGRQGNAFWTEPETAEATMLTLVSPEDAYKPREIVTPAVAKKIKALKGIWADVLDPLTKRAPGKPKLVLGSDERPPIAVAASAADFDEIEP